jgi:hypothetical protein
MQLQQQAFQQQQFYQRILFEQQLQQAQIQRFNQGQLINPFQNQAVPNQENLPKENYFGEFDNQNYLN